MHPPLVVQASAGAFGKRATYHPPNPLARGSSPPVRPRIFRHRNLRFRFQISDFRSLLPSGRESTTATGELFLSLRDSLRRKQRETLTGFSERFQEFMTIDNHTHRASLVLLVISSLIGERTDRMLDFVIYSRFSCPQPPSVSMPNEKCTMFNVQ